MEESSREQGHSKRMNGIHGFYACKMELSEYVSRQQNGEPEKVWFAVPALVRGSSPAADGSRERRGQALRVVCGGNPFVPATMRTLRRQAKSEEEPTVDGASYVLKSGVLYRIFRQHGARYKQLMVLRELRDTIMKLAHDTPFSGHLGGKRTRERLWRDFYWPGVVRDVRKYCASCDVCQRTTPKGYNRRVPLGQVPIVEEPFKKVGVDIVGPIIPCSARGHKYILVVVDYATRYPKAVPLKKQDAATVAEALW
ncbi:hypothetical protein ACOMHN_016758 [Nucella lapillus]